MNALGKNPNSQLETLKLVYFPQFIFNFLTLFNNNANSLGDNQISEELDTLIYAQVQKRPLSQDQQKLLVKCVKEVANIKSKEWLFVLASTKSVKRIGIHSPIKLVPSDLLRMLAKFFV